MKNHLLSKFCKSFTLSFFLMLALSVVAFSQNESIDINPNLYPPVTIANTETRPLFSKVLNQEMLLYVKIPASYNKNTDRVYPCLYCTDANLAFPMVANIASLFELPVITEPQFFVVGIAYKIRDMGDWGAWRTRDLTPTNVPATDKYYSDVFSKITGRQVEAKTGGAAKFLEFLVGEVFPFIETNYRVSPTGRALTGHSFGGLFSLYVMLTRPELFSLYSAGSPSIYYDKGLLFNLEKEYAATHKDLNAKLFMSYGGAEDSTGIANMKKMESLLKSRNYPGFKVETQVFPGETHQTCVVTASMSAARFLFYKK